MRYDPDIPADLLVALDACRADRRDEELPEVSAAIAAHPPRLVERARSRVQQADRAIAAAMGQVPVPEGLADRILANLAHQPPLACAVASDDAEPTSARPRPWSIVRLRRVSRRKVLAVAVPAVVVVFLLTLVFRPRHEPLDAAQIDQFARDFYATDDHDAGLVHTDPPRQFPIDGRLAAHVQGWRKLAPGFFDLPTVAYELASHRRVRATLYVVDSRSLTVTGIGPSPAPVATGGIAVGAWQSGDKLYVLVVQGGARQFESYFRQSSLT